MIWLQEVTALLRQNILGLLLAMGLAGVANAQIAIGNTGVTMTTTLSYGSDWASRGFSQTRGRLAIQTETELVHASGLYVGAAISEVRHSSADTRRGTEIWGGYRFDLYDFNIDIGTVSYLYSGFSAGASSDMPAFFEGYLKLTRQFGPVQVLGQLGFTPNYFGGTGLITYFEAGADWTSGIWDLTLGGRVALQRIDGTRQFNTSGYGWWGVEITREFKIEGIGAIVLSAGYMGAIMAPQDCSSAVNTSLEVCSQRAMGRIAFQF